MKERVLRAGFAWIYSELRVARRGCSTNIFGGIMNPIRRFLGGFLATVVASVLCATLAAPAHAIVITTTTDANTLVSTILGPGVTLVGTPTYIGVTDQSGTFTVGGDSASGVGFDSGIIMTSGNANQVPGANSAAASESLSSQNISAPDNVNTILGTTGDAQLTVLAGNATFDAASLTFSFQFSGGGGGDLAFNFVFGSEEYINYVGSEFNDVFAFFVDGVNVALVPGTALPVTINNVNPTTNAAFYRNNVNNPDGFPNLGLNLGFDGLTTVLTAQALGLAPGVHTMKIAVADTSDGILDAGVFIQGGSFSTQQPTPVPEPGTLALLAIGLAGVAGLRLRRRG